MEETPLGEAPLTLGSLGQTRPPFSFYEQHPSLSGEALMREGLPPPSG